MTHLNKTVITNTCSTKGIHKYCAPQNQDLHIYWPFSSPALNKSKLVDFNLKQLLKTW